MRYALAVVTLLLSLVLIGSGIAQRTVFAGADNVTATSDDPSDVAVTVLDGETLNALPGLQDVRVSGSDEVFAAYARTTDVLAWVGDTTYKRLAYDADSASLVTRVVTGEEDAVPAPAGSDLWLKEYTGDGDLRMPVRLDDDLSVLIVSDGTAPAPSEVSVTWPLDNRTPWAGPLLAGGAALLLLALLFLIWAVVHQRRSRGPRRRSIRPPRSSRMPRLPRQRSYRVRKPRPVVQTRGRRAIGRMTAVVPLTLAATLALGGCSADLWPAASDVVPSPSASPSTSAESDAGEPIPAAASVAQVKAIVDDVARVAEGADAALDAEALESRFDGPALTLRAANYAIRKADSAFPAPAAIPTDTLSVSLPQITGDVWPRTMMAIVQGEAVEGEEARAPLALTLRQDTPRAQYKVVYAVDLEPGAELPALAPKGVGALPLGPESPVLSMAPGELATNYVDVVNLGDQSASYGLFDIESDAFFPQVGPAAREARRTADDLDPAKAALEFTNTPAAEEIALSSNEAGALVNVSFTETVVAKPTEEGATLNLKGAVKTLAGVEGSTKGVTADYSDHLLFYIPPVGSSEKVVLLGVAQGLVSAKELP